MLFHPFKLRFLTIHIFLVVLSWGFTGTAIGAKRYLDLADVQYSFLPSPASPNVASEFVTVNVKFPLLFKNGDAVIVGGSYNSFHIRDTQVLEFYNITLPIGFHHVVDKESTFTTIVLNRLNSDFNGLNPNHFQIGCISTYEKTVSSRLSYQLGAYYNRELFGHFLVPIVGVDWHASPNWRFHGTVPRDFAIDYSAGPNLTLGAHFYGQVATYAVNNSTSTYIHRTKNIVGLFADIQPLKGVIVQVSTGYLVGTSYQSYTIGDQMDFGLSMVKIGDDRNLISETKGSGIYAQIKLIYRLDLSQQ